MNEQSERFFLFKAAMYKSIKHTSFEAMKPVARVFHVQNKDVYLLSCSMSNSFLLNGLGWDDTADAMNWRDGAVELEKCNRLLTRGNPWPSSSVKPIFNRKQL